MWSAFSVMNRHSFRAALLCNRLKAFSKTARSGLLTPAWWDKVTRSLTGSKNSRNPVANGHPSVTAAKVRPMFEEYLGVPAPPGCANSLSRVSERVTLSTHAGVSKPDRAVFEKALSRLHSKAALNECLFITENADHIRAASQTLGMAVLQFKAPGTTHYDFDDWSQAPALIAHLADPHQTRQFAWSRASASGGTGGRDARAQAMGESGKVRVTGQVWRKVPCSGIRN